MIIMIIIANTVTIWFHESLGFQITPVCRDAPSRGTTRLWVCWREVGGVVGKRLGVGCPCTPVRNDIVTPHHLLISKSRCQYFESFINVFLQHFSFFLAFLTCSLYCGFTFLSIVIAPAQGRRTVRFFTTATPDWCPDRFSVPTET